MTSRYHGSKISGYEQSFLDREGHLHCRTLKSQVPSSSRLIWEDRRASWATVLFLGAIMHRNVIHSFIVFLFSAIFAGPRFVEIQKFW